jgi:hypothetical protein
MVGVLVGPTAADPAKPFQDGRCGGPLVHGRGALTGCSDLLLARRWRKYQQRILGVSTIGVPCSQPRASRYSWAARAPPQTGARDELGVLVHINTPGHGQGVFCFRF